VGAEVIALGIVGLGSVGGTRGGGNGGKVVEVVTGGNGRDQRNGRRDGTKSSVVVDHDGDGGGPDPDEAAHFVGGAKEGPAEVMGVVEDGDPLLIVRREKKGEGLDELRQFFTEARLGIHRAGETGDVAVTSLVHRGDRGEECFPGGVELHDFLSY